MESREGDVFQPFPGSDALRTARLFESFGTLPHRSLKRYLQEGSHRLYLENRVYDEYLHMPKSFIDGSDIEQLCTTARELESEDLPKYLDAAGWAYAEAGLMSDALSTVERVELIHEAEKAWARGLVNSMAISDRFSSEYQSCDNEGHRIAVNIAFAPLMKSIIVGDVREDVMYQTLRDVTEIARDSRRSLDRAREGGDEESTWFHSGFLFEASALMTLLYMNDPRYVPLPATAKGGSGYYNARQTHDVSVINQHWGEIKKITPVEVKSAPSRRSNRRYEALVIPGKVRLSISDSGMGSSETVDAFYDLVNGQATTEQFSAIEQLATQLREMLRLYQCGDSMGSAAVKGVTRFHDSRKVAEVFPELSKDISKSYWRDLGRSS